MNSNMEIKVGIRKLRVGGEVYEKAKEQAVMNKSFRKPSTEESDQTEREGDFKELVSIEGHL